jgi:integrase/recombinase XerD
VFLTKEEVDQFVRAIIGSGERWDEVPLARLRFRALVEVLLGTGARISEILSLDRRDVDSKRREVKIVGKGRKQRVLSFTNRALEWLGRYLECRQDDGQPLFVTRGSPPRRLGYDAVKTVFPRFAQRARLNKKVTAHVLRHTVATTLLFNGCPIGHIKELLGHERLDTTCRYYLGLDVRAAGEAHRKFLRYE